MDKELEKAILLLLDHVEGKCRQRKVGEYDGCRCDDIPIKDYPLEKWCAGCLKYLIQKKLGR